MPTTSLLLLLTLLIFTTQVNTASATCEKLSSPFPLCPEVTYETTTQDTEPIVKDITDALNDISSRGFDNSDASCIVALSRALCYQKFIRCDPVTGNIPKVCESIRQDVLTIFDTEKGFRDTGPLKEILDSSRYGDTADCYPSKAVPDAPVVEKKGKPSATVPEAEAAPVVTVTVTAPMSEPTATEKKDTEKVKKVGVKSHLNSAPDEPAEPTTPQNTCTNSDLEVKYGLCNGDGARDMTFAIKKDATCADPWNLLEFSDQVACACTEQTPSSFLTTCSEKGTQNRLYYHRNLLPFTTVKPWPCDRRTELPPMESDIICPNDSDKVSDIPNETLFDKDSIEISWSGKSSRTGLQRVGCAKPPLKFPLSDDPAAECSLDEPVEAGSGFTGWVMKGNVTHSDSPPKDVLSFLELNVTSLPDAISPSVLFTFSVNSAPHFYGLRFLLDGIIEMPLTTNQTELKSYAVALKPGKAHTARWEYLTGPDGWEDIDKATGEEYRAVLQNVYLANAKPNESGTDNTEEHAEKQEDTGVSLSLVAGILLLSVAAVGGVAFLSRRKRRRKDLGGFVGVDYSSNGDKEFVFLRKKNGTHEENLELESFDVFGDSDNEFDQDDNDDSSNRGSEAHDRLDRAKAYPAPGTPFLDVDSEEEALVGAGVGTG